MVSKNWVKSAYEACGSLYTEDATLSLNEWKETVKKTLDMQDASSESLVALLSGVSKLNVVIEEEVVLNAECQSREWTKVKYVFR